MRPALKISKNLKRANTYYQEREEQGSASVEVAVSVFPFLFIILASLQLLIFCFHSVSLQYATSRVARWASVGDIDAAASRSYSDIQSRFRDEIRRFGLDETTIRIKICPQDNTNCSGHTPGSARQRMVLTATKDSSSIFGVADIPIVAKVTLRNEAF